MCGIAGIVGAEAPVSARAVERMRDALAHRGPDDHGLYVSPDGACGLGHRRLSIIDLSPLGRQPMGNEDGTVQIVFNGEVYNFAALREELERAGHRFRSRTDTEAVVHAYEEWGDACVDRLRGMFAFCIWDARRKRLFAARDPFGIKPLHYVAGPREFRFASELKGLLVESDVSREIDRSALYDYLSYRYVPTPKTAYAGVRKLPPAHTLSATVIDGEIRYELRRYWRFRFAPTDAATAEGALGAAWIDSVRSHLVADVPLGVFLSGGIDSSAVAATLAQDLGVRPSTFAIGFDAGDANETPYARQVAEHLGTDHHERIVGLGGLDAALDRVVDTYDEPFADASAVPTYGVCEAARKSVTAVLSGDGGDELFGGYGWYRRGLDRRAAELRLSRLFGSTLDRLRKAAPGSWKIRSPLRDVLLTPLERYLKNIGVFTRYEKQLFLSSSFLEEFRDYDDVWQLREHWRDDVDPLTAMQELDVATYLPDDILAKVDRASMAVSLEVRVPFLDRELAAVVALLPVESRMVGSTSKIALRRLLRDRLPREILERRKQGFSAPLRHWLNPDDVRKRIMDGPLVASGMIDPAKFRRLSSRHLQSGKGWALLVLDQWMRRRSA